MATASIAPTIVARFMATLPTALAGLGDNHTTPVVQESFSAEYSTWDTVIIGDQLDGTHVIQSMRAGRKTREESFIQHVWFRVVRVGAESTASRAAAFRQLAALEDLLANDPTNGTAEPTLRMNVAGFTCNTTTDAGSGGWMSVIRADVRVDVRLV